MAVDRTKAYYKEWTNDVNWNMRLEIIPAGEFVSALTNIDAVTFELMNRGMVTIKTHKSSFDKIPMGVRDAQSMEIEFDFTDLQDGLKEMLKNPFYEHISEGYTGLITTNIIVLKSDRGTGTTPTVIEFAGGQRSTLSNKYTMSKDVATGAFYAKGCTIEAIDILKLVFEQVTTQAWADYILAHPTDMYLKSVLANLHCHDWGIVNGSTWVAKYDYEAGFVAESVAFQLFTEKTAAHFQVGAYLFNQGLLRAITTNLAAWSRNTPATYNVTCDLSPFDSITFYKQDSTVSHAKGSALSDTQVLTLGWVDHSVIADAGMLFPDEAGESYLEYTYLWDLLKALCEGMCTKLTYKPLMILDSASVLRLSYSISYSKIFDNPSGVAIDLSNRFADAQEDDFDFTPCSGVYTGVECEVPNMKEPDISNFIAKTTGTNSDERINIKLVHSNLPTTNIIEVDGTFQLAEQRIYPRKLYYAETAGVGYAYPLKVHESVTIDDGITSTDYDVVTPLPNRAAFNNFADELRAPECSAWATETQLTNGLPYAVSNFYLSRFSNFTQSEIPVKMFMVDGETMPENVGDIATIPVVDGFAGSTIGCMIEMEADWQAGTVDITFITRGA